MEIQRKEEGMQKRQLVKTLKILQELQWEINQSTLTIIKLPLFNQILHNLNHKPSLNSAYQ